MVEIIYLDIDGTLRDEQEGIPQSTIKAMEECRKKALRIILCTGRNPASVQADVQALQTDGMISGGGCYICLTGKRRKTVQFAAPELESILKAAQKEDMFLSLEGETQIYMDRQAALFYRRDFEQKILTLQPGERERVRAQNGIRYREGFSLFKPEKDRIHKICAWGSREAAGQLSEGLKESAQVIQKKEWNGLWYLELLPKGCSKGSAVEWVNRELGVLKENTMSFGDSENDIDMLEATGISVALGNGVPALKKIADCVCEPLLEDGIYKELMRRKIIG